MQRHIGGFAPLQHHFIEFPERMPDVHQQDQALQASPVTQVCIEMLVPMCLQSRWDLGIAVARQIHQPLLVGQAEKVYQLRSSGCFAGSCQFALPGEHIDSTGFPRIRAAAECDFSTLVCGALMQLGCTLKESGVVKDDGQISVLFLAK